MDRTYDELITLPSFEERYRYLRTTAQVGQESLGYLRMLAENFYRSKEWKDLRRYIVLRDQSCDLACRDRMIDRGVVIHHMNVLQPTDFLNRTKYLLDPKYMITTQHSTHNAIHYGDESLLIPSNVIERAPNDTCPWR